MLCHLLWNIHIFGSAGQKDPKNDEKLYYRYDDEEKQFIEMGLSSKNLAGPGYIILNVLRVMNIIGLLAVVTASVVMLVNAFTTNISKVRGESSLWHTLGTDYF